MSKVQSRAWVESVRVGGAECVMEDGSVLTALCDSHDMLEAAAEYFKGLVERNEGRIKNIVDEKLSRDLADAEARVVHVTEERDTFRRVIDRNVDAFCALHVLSNELALVDGPPRFLVLASLIRALVDGNADEIVRLTKEVTP